MGAVVKEETDRGAFLTPAACGTFYNSDIEVVGRSIQSALKVVKARKEEKCGDDALVRSVKSLMDAYAIAVRATVREGGAADGDSESPLWKRLLKTTRYTGRVIADLCSLQDVEGATANVVMQMISDLLRPPLQSEQMTDEEVKFFWHSYPWWYCLLHHCLVPSFGAETICSAAHDMAFRALGWVSSHYAAAGAVGGSTFGDVNVFAFLTAVNPSSRLQEGDFFRPKPVEHHMPSSFGRMGVRDTMSPTSLGQSMDVGSDDIIPFFIDTKRWWLGTQHVHDENDTPDLGGSSSAAVVASYEACWTSNRVCDVEGAVTDQRKGGEEFCCNVCSIMERRFSQQNSTTTCSSAALSLLVLHRVFSSAPPRAPVPGKRSVLEKVAMAAVVGLLQHDADVADALLSVLARASSGSASRCFLAFWRVAFYQSAGNLFESVAWLLAGLARIITLHAAVRGKEESGKNAFMGALDEVVESVVDVLNVLISSNFGTDTDVPSQCAGELYLRGFIEVWNSLLHLAPKHVSPALERCLSEFIVDGNPENTTTAHGALRLGTFLERYFASVVGERLTVLQQQAGEVGEATFMPQEPFWWPCQGLAAHEHCRRVLQHTLALSEYVCRVDLASRPWYDTVMRSRRHPATFFLEGNKGLCLRLLFMHPENTIVRQVGELRRVAVQIISASVRTLSTNLGRSTFASPFGESSGQYVAEYAKLLYLCFLEEAQKPKRLEYPYMRALLQALRSLVVVEKGACCTAENLSFLVTLSSMLPRDTVIVDLGGTVVVEATPLTTPLKESATVPDTPVCTLTGDIGSNCGAVYSQRVGSGNSSGVFEAVQCTTRRPLIPALSLSALVTPPYVDPSEVRDDAATQKPYSFDVVAPSKLTVPPLKIMQSISETSIPAGVRSLSQQQPHLTLDDPATVAELLLLVCCLLLEGESGMIAQSAPSVAHYCARRGSTRPQNSIAGVTSPFVYLLETLKDFMRHSAKSVSVQLFERLLTDELQTSSYIRVGVDVLRQLLLWQINLLDGWNVIRRISAGGYGGVFYATHSCSPHTPCCYEWCMGNAQPVALKMFPISKRDGDCTMLVSCHTEVTALLRLQGHPHICKLLFFGCSDTHYVIALPFYKGGSLREWRLTNSAFPVSASCGNVGFSHSNLGSSVSSKHTCLDDLLSVCGPIFAQVLEAVEFMHTNRIRHNDIKADNILIEDFRVEVVPLVRGKDRDKRQLEEEKDLEEESVVVLEENEVVIPTSVRVCDFGVCEAIGEGFGSVSHAGVGGGDTLWGLTKGTEAVQAPELFSLPNVTSFPMDALPGGHDESNVVRDAAADMWACGCLLYELLTGVMLFEGADMARLFTFAATSREAGGVRFEVLLPHQRHVLDTLGCGITDFALQLLALDPAKRPSASAARQAWDNIMRMHG